MKKSLQMASAFIGIIVGAGFASGQEILQYFTSFGLMGFVAAFVSTIAFGYLGMHLTSLGSRMRTTSHKEVVYRISGKFFGRIVDGIIILTLFGVGVVMIAGAGSIFSQQFGLSATLGSTIMAIAVIFTIMLNVQKVIAIIGGVTPFLAIVIVILAVYSFMTMDTSFEELHRIAIEQPTTLPNWWMSAINYVSFNIAVGASMAIVMGGTEKDTKIASQGGFIGGLGLGVLIMMSHFTIFSKIDDVAGVDMPMLKIMDDIHPFLGIFMSFILFGMIYNTAVGMLFSFSARFVQMGTRKFKVFVVFVGLTAYMASFVGFTQLVRLFYPIVGYLGLFLVGAIILASFRHKKETAN